MMIAGNDPLEPGLILQEIRQEMARALVGQSELVDGLLIGLLTGSHLLIEGVPGLAKTLAVKTLAQVIGGSFSRIQFTPDLLPADITGTTVYRPADQTFVDRIGPIAANLVLADEINRAPAKTQSALLEVMQEKQVTISGHSHPMPVPFLVIATQNPIEQTGTYPLPEAQKDRFALCLRVGYPSRADEREIVSRWGWGGEVPLVRQVCTPARLLQLQASLAGIHVDDRLCEYALDLVIATRPGASAELSAASRQAGFAADELLDYGASPRATLTLMAAARARALVHDRDYVLPEDLQHLAVPVLAHRLVLNFAAETKHLTAEAVVRQLVRQLPVP